MNAQSGAFLLYRLPGEFFSFSGKIMKKEAGKKATPEEIWPKWGDYNI